jgi:hypothetical protein
VTVSGDLLVNTTYSEVSFLNESVTPVDDITVEVKEEVGTSTVFLAPGSNWSLYYADADGNGKPIGLAFTLRTGGSCSWQYSSHLETRAS